MKTIFALLATTLLTSACEPHHETSLQERKAQWLDRRPAHYVVQTCTHGIVPPGCVRAVVERGSVAAAQERIYGYLGDDYGWEDVKLKRDPLEQMLDDALSPRDGCRIEPPIVDDHYSFIYDYRTQCSDGAEGGRYVACFLRDETRLESCDAWPEGAMHADAGTEDDAGE